MAVILPGNDLHNRDSGLQRDPNAQPAVSIAEVVEELLLSTRLYRFARLNGVSCAYQHDPSYDVCDPDAGCNSISREWTGNDMSD